MAKAAPGEKNSYPADDHRLSHAAWESTAEAMLLFGPEGTVLDANPSFLALIGLTRERLTGLAVSLIFARNFAEVVRSRAVTLSDAPDAQPASPLYETTLTRPDGEERVVEMCANFVLESSRRLALLVGGHDVTERRRSELAVSASAASYRTLVQNLPNGLVLLFDRDFTILVAGGASFSKLGLASQDMIGKKIYEALSPDELTQVAPAYEAVLQGITTVAEVTRGDQIYEVHHEPLIDELGVITGGLVLSQNITFRKHSEEVARRLAALVESSNDAIIGKSLDGTIHSWNGAAERFYGYSADEVIGHSVPLLIPVDHPDELQTILNRIAAGEKVAPYDTVRLCDYSTSAKAE